MAVDLGKDPIGNKKYKAGTYWSRREDEIIKNYFNGNFDRWFNVLEIRSLLLKEDYIRNVSGIRSRIWKLRSINWNLDNMKYFATKRRIG